jgi:hypothetical protein
MEQILVRRKEREEESCCEKWLPDVRRHVDVPTYF